jgi:hypothetical protein
MAREGGEVYPWAPACLFPVGTGTCVPFSHCWNVPWTGTGMHRTPPGPHHGCDLRLTPSKVFPYHGMCTGVSLAL